MQLDQPFAEQPQRPAVGACGSARPCARAPPPGPRARTACAPARPLPSRSRECPRCRCRCGRRPRAPGRPAGGRGRACGAPSTPAAVHQLPQETTPVVLQINVMDLPGPAIALPLSRPVAASGMMPTSCPSDAMPAGNAGLPFPLCGGRIMACRRSATPQDRAMAEPIISTVPGSEKDSRHLQNFAIAVGPAPVLSSNVLPNFLNTESNSLWLSIIGALIRIVVPGGSR